MEVQEEGMGMEEEFVRGPKYKVQISILLGPKYKTQNKFYNILYNFYK